MENNYRKENKIENKRVNKEKSVDKLKGNLRIGIWNVRGPYDEGAVKKVTGEMKKYGYDHIVSQETKQKGREVIEIDDYIFFSNGGDKRRLGTGFLASKKIKHVIVEFKPVSERLYWIGLKGKYQKISLISIDVPTEETNIEGEDELDNIFERIPRYDLKTILGDANAKVGKEEIYKHTIGRFSKHEHTNENGQLLIHFAKEKGMRIKSTYFEKK